MRGRQCGWQSGGRRFGRRPGAAVVALRSSGSRAAVVLELFPSWNLPFVGGWAATMAVNAFTQALRRTLFRVHSGNATDCDLLQRFVAHQEEAAFEELVRRHGPMVLRLCRRVLRQPQDA